MSPSARALVLFDVDLTLIDSGGAGREAMERAFRELYGLDGAFASVEFAGRTDRDLLADALRRHGLPDGDMAGATRAFRDAYLPHLTRTLVERPGRVLPGVVELLEYLSHEPGVTMGLATGNFRGGAERKLAHYGLLGFFAGGGFGDDVVDRAVVVAQAARAVCGAALEDAMPPVVLVVGDTPRDVAAALANGFTAVGVATGFHGPDALEQAGAALVLPDFLAAADAARALLALADHGTTALLLPEPDAYDEAGPGCALEREAKFAASAAALEELSRAPAIPGGYALRPGRVRSLTDAYYDTPDHGLLRHGWVLRLRHADGRTKVTLKSLSRGGSGAIHERTELEGAIIAGPLLSPARWPARVRDQVMALVGPEPELVPVLFLEHARHLIAVARDSDPAAGELAEMSVERVAVMSPDRQERHHGAPDIVAALCEVELEAASATTDDELRSMADGLAAMPGLSPLAQSKFERSLRLISGHPVGYGPDVQAVQCAMTMADAGRLVWRTQLAEMLLNESGAREGTDIEHVHDMRVATRRARAAAEIFGRYLGPERVTPLVKGLRRTGRALGPVRDLDVALLRLAQHRAAAPAAEARGLDALAARWRRARSEAYEVLLAWIDSGRYRRFLVELETCCAAKGGAPAGGAGAFAVPSEVRHVMPAAIVERFAVVRAHETRLASGRPSEAELHALRIHCKRLRYSLEFVRHLLGTEGEALIGQLKLLQDHLGDLNDSRVTRDRLRLLRAEGLDHPAIERYERLQERTVEQLRTTFDPVWLPFVDVDNRRLLMEAVARL